MEASGSVSRNQLQLWDVSEGRGLEARDQEGCEPLQQQLVVVLEARRHLLEELEQVRAEQRIGERAHHEVQAPCELLAREVWQRLVERLLVAPDHLRVLLREEMADEGGRIRVGPPHQAQEVLPPTLL